MSQTNFTEKLSKYRYEFLVVTLLLLIFDKIFFPTTDFYLKYIWIFNRILVAIACYGIFMDRGKIWQFIRIIFSAIAILMPLGYVFLPKWNWFDLFLNIFFMVFYLMIFVEIIRQVTEKKEVKWNVIIGSFCGYLLLSRIFLYALLTIKHFNHNAFHGLSSIISDQVDQLSYFSLITISSIGYGDIYPLSEPARFTSAFFGIMGQFYTITIIGIIISRFTSITNDESSK